LRNPTLRATTLALVSRTSALDLSLGQSAASSRERRLLEKLNADNRVQVALTVQDGTHG
jgi:DNA-binding NarL/FixJ family response regulator